MGLADRSTTGAQGIYYIEAMNALIELSTPTALYQRQGRRLRRARNGPQSISNPLSNSYSGPSSSGIVQKIYLSVFPSFTTFFEFY